MVKKALLAGAIVLTVLFGIWLKRVLDIDRCLDSGGRWNYKDAVCEETRDQASPK